MTDKREPDFHEELIEINDEQMKKARKRLGSNLTKEAEEIDPRLMFLKLKKGFLEQYGRINAANTRANDNLHYISALDRNLAGFKAEMYDKFEKMDIFDKELDEFIKKLCNEYTERDVALKISDIEQKLKFQQEIFSNAIELMNEKQQPWYKTLWKKIIGRS